MRARTLPDGTFEIKTRLSESHIRFVSGSILFVALLIGLTVGAPVGWLLFGSFVVALYLLAVSFSVNAHIVIDEKKDIMIVRAGGRVAKRSYSALIGLVKSIEIGGGSRVGLEFDAGGGRSEYFFFGTSYSGPGLFSNNDRILDGLEFLLKVRTNRVYE